MRHPITEIAEMVRFTGLGQGTPAAAAVIAAQAGASTSVQRILKAAVGAGSLGDPAFAGSLADVRDASESFVDALRAQSILVRLVEDAAMLPIPRSTRAVVVVADASAAVVGEGAPVPVSRIELAGFELAPRKAATIVAISAELLRSTSTAARGLLDRSLQAGVSAALDRALVEIASAGVTPIAATGTSAADAFADLQSMLSGVKTVGGGLYWILAPDVAIRAATMQVNGQLVFPALSPVGGELLNLPAFVSPAVSAGRMLLINAGAFGGEIGEITINLAEHATLEMNDTPASPPTAATVATSLWQQNLVGMQAVCHFGLERLRNAAVAVLDGIAWE